MTASDGASGDWGEKGMLCENYVSNQQPCLRP
jgi:hypothetical protein